MKGELVFLPPFSVQDGVDTAFVSKADMVKLKKNITGVYLNSYINVHTDCKFYGDSSQTSSKPEPYCIKAGIGLLTRIPVGKLLKSSLPQGQPTPEALWPPKQRKSTFYAERSFPLW